jgi:hypothetical protein
LIPEPNNVFHPSTKKKTIIFGPTVRTLNRIGENSRSLLSLSSGIPRDEVSLLSAQVDGLVGNFIREATDLRTLAAMMAGGMAYRLGRIGAMSTRVGAPLRIASLGIGLGAEVTAFEMTNRSLSSLTGEIHSNPNLWRWDGQGGIRQGLLNSLVTFGALKGAGRLAQGENVVVQHLLQDMGMVLGHQVSGSFGITQRQTGSLVEQFLHAEVTNLQLGAGMALAHSVAPGIQGLERGLDLSLRSTEIPPTPLLQRGEKGDLAFAAAGDVTVNARDLPVSSETDRQNIKGFTILKMSTDGGRGEGTPLFPPDVEAIRTQIQERHDMARKLLGESLDQLLRSLRTLPLRIKDPLNMLESLRRVEGIQDFENRELLDLAVRLAEAGRSGALPEDRARRFLQDLEGRYSRIYRTREQIDFALRVLTGSATEKDLSEIRRRLEWVLETPEFKRPFTWPWTPATVPEAGSPQSFLGRYERGLGLLLRFHPRPTQVDFQLFTRVAQGPIRRREIAFDLDGTVGDGLVHLKAEKAVRLNSHRYDVGFEHFVHQYARMRIPYRNMQALLLGLWAAGNRLKVSTASDNVPDNHEAFFNDFPLLKIAFGFTTPEDPFRVLTPIDLDMHPHFMDLRKREKFHHRHFETPEGRAFLGRIRMERGLDALPFLLESKFPLPDFRFDALVDDQEHYAQEMEMLGFGRRWIPAQDTGERMFEALLDFYSRPPPETADLLKRWLVPDLDEGPPSDPTVVSLAARQAGVQTSPALERIREVMAEWGKDLHVSEFKREWREFEFRLTRRPPNQPELLSKLIDSHPAAAKVLIRKLGLVPPDSVFASARVVHPALFLPAEDTILPVAFDSKAQVIWRRFLHEPFPRTPPESLRLASLSKWEREVRLGCLPNVIFEALADPALETDLFIFLAETWGLGER